MPDGDRAELQKWGRSSVKKAGLMLRARIVLLAGDGVAHAASARRLSVVAPDGDQLAGPV
jgi:hypothetical protein